MRCRGVFHIRPDPAPGIHSLLSFAVRLGLLGGGFGEVYAPPLFMILVVSRIIAQMNPQCSGGRTLKFDSPTNSPCMPLVVDRDLHPMPPGLVVEAFDDRANWSEWEGPPRSIHFCHSSDPCRSPRYLLVAANRIPHPSEIGALGVRTISENCGLW